MPEKSQRLIQFILSPVSLKTFKVGVKSTIENSTDDNTIVANRYSSW